MFHHQIRLKIAPTRLAIVGAAQQVPPVGILCRKRKVIESLPSAGMNTRSMQEKQENDRPFHEHTGADLAGVQEPPHEDEQEDMDEGLDTQYYDTQKEEENSSPRSLFRC